MNNKIEQWIIEADIASMQKAMECGETTSEQLVRIYIARIEQYDKGVKGSSGDQSGCRCDCPCLGLRTE